MKLLLIIGALGMSFILALLSIPTILRIARAKNLYDSFDERKIHKQLVPPLGGVAIFIGFLFTTILSSYQMDFNSLKYVILASSIMFFIGLKDDLIAIAARKKFIIQFCAAIILVLFGNFRFSNLHGILGIYEINYVFSLFISIFFIIAVTNAFNLIDGIDGLASGLAIVGMATLGTWFTLSGNYEYAVVCASLGGSLAAFFLFNVFGHKNKLFMGDTGSLIIGIVFSILVIRFNELNIIIHSKYAVQATPVISLAIGIVPIVDIMRVTIIRLRNKKSPFKADTNHIHHLLLKIYDNHLKATLTLVFFTLLMLGFSLVLNYSTLNQSYQFLIILSTGIIFSQLPSLIINQRNSKMEEKDSQKASFSTPVFHLHQWTKYESSERLLYRGRLNRKIHNEQKTPKEKEPDVIRIEFR